MDTLCERAHANLYRVAVRWVNPGTQEEVAPGKYKLEYRGSRQRELVEPRAIPGSNPYNQKPLRKYSSTQRVNVILCLNYYDGDS